MKTFKELFYWFEFKAIQILLYIAAFRTKVKAEKSELQFQDMSAAVQLIIFSGFEHQLDFKIKKCF